MCSGEMGAVGRAECAARTDGRREDVLGVVGRGESVVGRLGGEQI